MCNYNRFILFSQSLTCLHRSIFHTQFDVLANNTQQAFAGNLFCWFAQFVNMGIAISQFWKTEGAVAPEIKN